jgi:hypothetical protein
MAQLFVLRKRFWPRSDKNPGSGYFFDWLRQFLRRYRALCRCCGSTTLPEQLSPEETVAMLTDYFGAMVEAIFKNFGHLNATINFRRNIPCKPPRTREAL